MSDWVGQWLMPDLQACILREAPGVSLQVTASDPFRDSDQLQNGEIDLAISVGNHASATLLREEICALRFCAIWHPDRLNLKTPLTLKDYAEHDHLLVSYRGAAWSAIDEQLTLLGTSRRIRYVTPHFSALPPLLVRIPALATVPSGLAADWACRYGLRYGPVPVNTPEIPLSLLWHKRLDNDMPLNWLKNLLRNVMQERA